MRFEPLFQQIPLQHPKPAVPQPVNRRLRMRVPNPNVRHKVPPLPPQHYRRPNRLRHRRKQLRLLPLVVIRLNHLRLKKRPLNPLHVKPRRRKRKNKPRQPSHPPLGVGGAHSKLYPVHLKTRRKNTPCLFRQVSVKERVAGYVRLKGRKKLHPELVRQLPKPPPQCEQPRVNPRTRRLDKRITAKKP